MSENAENTTRPYLEGLKGKTICLGLLEHNKPLSCHLLEIDPFGVVISKDAESKGEPEFYSWVRVTYIKPLKQPA